MAALHLFWIMVASYGFFIAIQGLDERYLLPQAMRKRTWNYASWGAAVYFDFKPLSFLAWGWVSRFRFDGWLERVFRARATGDAASTFGARFVDWFVRPRNHVRPARAHVLFRAALGFLTGILEFLVFAILISVVEYLLADVLGLPSYGGIGG